MREGVRRRTRSVRSGHPACDPPCLPPFPQEARLMERAEPGDMRQATLHCGVASLTATAERAPFNLHARHVRKDAP
ncbi:DUF6380 family protein [Streptomyces sp. NPDC048304]|uniref:DUF6380 family protein n=1 Tax=Streptomyces sp. NPDC048304 TaxID=3154820 RepID=UPI0033DEAFD1